jgi:predicted PurR-regulated permease PerM
MSSPKSITLQTPKPITVALVVALIGGFFLLKSYLAIVALAILAAHIVNPVYQWVKKKSNGNEGTAIVAAVTTVTLAVVLPVTLVLTGMVIQSATLISRIQALDSTNIENTLRSSFNTLNQNLARIPGFEDLQVNLDSIISTVRGILPTIANLFVQGVTQIAGSLFGAIVPIILFLVTLTAILRHQDALLKTIRRVSPFGDDVDHLYISRAGAMARAMVGGQLVIAITQGALSAISLHIAGLNFFWFFWVFFSFMNFIPTGSGIITLPIGAIYLLSGNIGAGLFIILFHLLVVTNIDIAMRPKLVPKNARMDPALLLLAVFSGIGIFGLLGVIYGPILMILIITTIEVYTKTHDEKKANPNTKTN